MKSLFKNILYGVALAATTCGCSDFLEEQLPQGTLSEEQVKDPRYVDNMVVSAYAIFTTSEDINSSFSMWNFDVRSDDAYKGGSGTSDGDVFHQLEVEQGVLTTNWNINDMWVRLYNCLSRVNSAIAVLNQCDDSYELREERLGEMRFLRAYGHFLLKRLYKYIPFVDETLGYDDYNNLSNRVYTNDEGWSKIIKDVEFAYNHLPDVQEEKARPTKAAAAAFLAKLYIYKAYHQDDAMSNKVTSINTDDLKKVIEYTDQSIYSKGGIALEDDLHNNFRPETQYENGCESIWAIQYSINDGSTYGNLNWSYGLITPNIAGVTDGGCDFYKPSQNLINAYRTNDSGLPIENFNGKDYSISEDNADPRLFLTVGIPGLPYMFNKKYIVEETSSWSRSNGLYGYNVTLKQNVDPDLIGQYLIKGSFWASPMNRIVFRYADILLLRAEAFAQLGQSQDAISIVNQIRSRAKQSVASISDYPSKYGVKMNISNYKGSYSKDETVNIVKRERRLEMGMECERFFDLVRWGEAADVINKYYIEEADNCAIYSEAQFTADKNEYLPIPFSQVAASNGNYVQNIGNW